MMIYWRDFSANDTVSVSWLCTLFLRQSIDANYSTVRMIAQLREAFGSAAAKLECEIIEMDGEPDHVHLLVAYPPKLAVSVMVNNLKSVSSRLLRQQNAHLRMQSKTGLLWSRSYFVCSTGGATIETLRAYVQSQSTPD